MDNEYEIMFKRLMNERNELRKYIIDICKSLDIDTSQSVLGADCLEFYAVLSSVAKDRISSLQEQLKRKGRECKELKEKVKELRQGWINCDKERNLQEANSEFRQRVINRYKQTISSIKNIVEEDFNHTCWETYAGQLEQILQKISEMEND